MKIQTTLFLAVLLWSTQACADAQNKASGPMVMSGPEQQLVLGDRSNSSSSSPNQSAYIETVERWHVPPGTVKGGLMSLFDNMRAGATGNRSVGSTYLISQGSDSPSADLTSFASIADLQAGTGQIFGANSVGKCGPNVENSASCYGAEIDVEAAAAVSVKAALQMVDTSPNRLGRGANIDTFIIALKGQHSAGMQHFMVVGHEINDPLVTDGTADILATGIIPSLNTAFDLHNIGDFAKAAMIVPVGKAAIWFGLAHEGGSLYSTTATDGVDIGLGENTVLFGKKGGGQFATLGRDGLLLGNGQVVAKAYKETLFTPSSSKSFCMPGQFSDDANFHYVCVAKDKWRRVALTDF